MPDIRSILDPLDVDRSLKAAAFDAFHRAKGPEEFQQQFDKLPLPKQAKAELFDAKFSSPPRRRDAETTAIPGTELTGLPGVPVPQMRVEMQGLTGAFRKPKGYQPSGAVDRIADLGEETVKAGYSGLVGTVEPLVSSGLKAVGLDQAAETTHRIGRGLQADFAADPEMKDPVTWMTRVTASAIGSMVPLIGVGRLGQAGLTRAMAAARIRGKLAPVVAAAGGGTLAGLTEAAVNSAVGYWDAKDSGASDEVARDVAREIATKTGGISVAAYAGGIFNTRLKGFRKAAISALSEAVEETATEFIANRAAQGTYDPQRNPTEGLLEAGVGGAMGGALLGGYSGQRQPSHAEVEPTRVAPTPTAAIAPRPQQRKPRPTLAPTSGASADPLAAPVAAETPRRLPRELAGAKPRFNFGEKAYELAFADDVDRAAYIAAQVKPSKRDAEYVRFVAEETGLEEGEIRGLGRMIRTQVKVLSRSHAPGALPVEAILRPYLERQRAAGNLGPVKQAPAAPSVETDADAAKDAPRGKTAPAKVARGYTVDTQYALVEADRIVASHTTGFEENPDYPQEVQPRDRTRKASLAQVEEIAAKLDPNELGANYKATDGAPILGEDLVVESGNGRTIALQKLYASGHANAGKYRAWLDAHAEEFGLDKAALAGMKKPVLVRLRASLPPGVSRTDFARDANESFTAPMSATEQAASDAGKLSGDLMALFRPSESGEILTADNREFVRGFFDRVVGPAERARYMTADGSISQEGAARVRNAVFAVAYGDTGAIEKLAEATDSNIKNVTSGMLLAAPKFASVREAIRRGELHDLDLTPDVAAAASKLSALREGGRPVGDYLAQEGMFGDDLSPEAREVLGAFARHSRSGRRIGTVLQTYAGVVEEIGSPKQESMFGTAVPTKMEVLQGVLQEVEAQHAREQEAKDKTGSGREGARAGAADPGARSQEAAGEGGPLSVAEQAARARLKKRGESVSLGSGLGDAGRQLADLADYAIVGAAKLQRGIAKFSDWSREMLREFGDAIKPRLLRIYGEARRRLRERDFGSERGSISLKPSRAAEAKDTAKAAADFVRPTLSRVRREPQGERLAGMIEGAADRGEVAAGKRVVRLEDAGLQKLSRAERINLLDALEGFADPESPGVERNFEAVRLILDEIAAESAAGGVLVREKRIVSPGDPVPGTLTMRQRARLEAGKSVVATVRRPFHSREDYYPHVIRSAGELKSGDIRKDVIQNLVRMGVRADAAGAEAMLDDYIKFVESGGRAESLIKFMLESGQARDDADAQAKLLQHRDGAIRRAGSLEHSRQVDLPFWDPDPARTLPRLVADNSIRLEQVRAFGQDNQRIQREILKIRRAGGDAAFVRAAVDRMLKSVNEADTQGARLGRMLRTLQGFKLGLAFIPNATQGVLNTMLAGDLGSAIAGVRGVASARGRRLAIESGATLESVINESMRHAGASGRALGWYLKAVGFTGTERANRIIAANGGLHYARKQARRLRLNPRDGRARKALTELGLDPDAIAKRGTLTADEVLLAAKKFSDLTQFRSRPQDLPFFASTEGGKVIFQFKSFLYGQTRLLRREIVDEFRAKRFGRGTRGLLLLATVFPITGAAVQALRNLLTGRDDDEDALGKYLDGLTQVGASGVLGDILQAGKFRRGAEFVFGPSAGLVGGAIDALGTRNRMENLAKFTARQIPWLSLAMQVMGERLFPRKKRRAAGAGEGEELGGEELGEELGEEIE